MSAVTAFAQDLQSVVKLKNGVVITGVIEEEISGGPISVRTAEGDLFIYQNSEILSIERPSASDLKASQRETAKKEAKLRRDELELGNFKGYRGIVDLSAGGQGVVLSVVNGYNFCPYFYAGVGVGVAYGPHDYELREDNGHTYMYVLEFSLPIYLHLRSSFLKNYRFSPYVSLDVGYEIDVQQAAPPHFIETGSNVFLQPAFGVEVRLNRKQAVSLALSLPIQFRRGMTVGASVGFSF